MKKNRLTIMTILDIILILIFGLATINSFNVYEYFFTATYFATTIIVLFIMCNRFYNYIHKTESKEKCNCDNGIKNIFVKYFTDGIKPLDKKEIGDWIDLRAAEDIELKKGEFRLIPLGVGMKLPYGYEANIVPRSSTYKNFKIIQTNSFAVIDNSYSGNDDQWMFPALAIEDTVIHKNDRICQFRINKIQNNIKFKTVDRLDERNRGGIGSSGVQ